MVEFPPPKCPFCDEPYVVFRGGPSGKNIYYKIQNRLCSHSGDIRTTVNMEDYERLVKQAYAVVPACYKARVTKVTAKLQKRVDQMIERYEADTQTILDLYRHAYGEDILFTRFELRLVLERVRNTRGLIRSIHLYRARIEVKLLGGGRVTCDIKGVSNITRTFDPEWTWVPPHRVYRKAPAVRQIWFN